MRRVFILVMFLGLFCGVNAAHAAAPDKAIEAAQTWLSFIDNNAIDQSWNASSSFFKSSVPKNAWEAACAGVRGPFGRMLSRELLDAKQVESMPGAPDGQYVVIQYRTVFANKKEATETITPQLESDGMWRVSGYFVQ